jgi:2'-5' RNA ligase
MAQCTYFFAIFPSDDERDATMTRAAHVRESLKLDGDLIDPQRLHLTSLFLGRHSSMKSKFEEKMVTGGSAARLTSFPITFNLASSLKSGDSYACAFEARALAIQVHAASSRLLSVVQRIAPEVLDDRVYRPHVTWMYSKSTFVETPIEPIVWQANRLVLACGLPSERLYKIVHEWLL